MLTTPELFIPDSTSSLTLKCLISTPNEIFNRHPKPNRAKNKFLISLDSVRAFYFISLAVNQTELLKRQIPKSSLLFLTSHKCCFKKSCSLRLIGSDYNLFPLLRPPILTHHQLVPGLLQQSHNWPLYLYPFPMSMLYTEVTAVPLLPSTMSLSPTDMYIQLFTCLLSSLTTM
jgi:hypothetical protein